MELKGVRAQFQLILGKTCSDTIMFMRERQGAVLAHIETAVNKSLEPGTASSARAGTEAARLRTELDALTALTGKVERLVQQERGENSMPKELIDDPSAHLSALK